MATTSVAVSIGFVGTGSLTKKDGTALKTVGDGYGTPGFTGNWYTYAELQDGISTSGFSGRIYVCYGATWVPTGTTTEPAFLPGTGDNSLCVFDKMELTFDGSQYSCADLTSIDFWAIPMNLISYKSGVQVAEVKGVKDSSSISDIQLALAALSNPVQSNATATELYNAAVAAGMKPPALNPTSAKMIGNSEFLRIVGPNSYPSFGNPALGQMMGLPFTPYNTFEPYLNYLIKNFGPTSTKSAVIEGLGAGVIATISGSYGGNPKAPKSTLTEAQTYSFSAEIDADMNLRLVGSGGVAGSATLLIEKWDLLNPSSMYGANPEFSINGARQTPQNDLYGWVLGDLFAGFNTGAIGTEQKVGGEMVGAMPSSDWFSKLDSSTMFSYLWPSNSNFYNQWAEALVSRSDAYNFAYAERFSAPLLSLNPANVDTMTIQFLGPVPVAS